MFIKKTYVTMFSVERLNSLSENMSLLKTDYRRGGGGGGGGGGAKGTFKFIYEFYTL